MLHELLELLLHAKSGAIAAVFLIGTTGALVTATVENGVTTITVTPNVSASPSASASATASPTGTASASASPSASPSATSTSSPTGSPTSSANCSDQAHQMAAALQEVNRAFSQYHSGLSRLHERARTDALRTDLANADALLKQLRDEANQKIHSLFTCAKSEDQDKEDQDEDNDEEHATSSASPSASPTASPSTTASPTATSTATAAPSSSPLVTGNDFKTVADNAVAAMKLVFDTVSAEFPTPTASAHPKPSFSPDRRGDNGGHEGGDRD